MFNIIYGGVPLGITANPTSLEVMRRHANLLTQTGSQGQTQYSLRYKNLSKALKGKERVPAMVEGFGSQEAWNTFQRNLALKLPQDFGL